MNPIAAVLLICIGVVLGAWWRDADGDLQTQGCSVVLAGVLVAIVVSCNP